MAITYVSVNNAAGQNAGSTSSSDTSITPTMPGSTVNDQSRIFVIQCASNTSGTTPANWTALFKDTVIGSGAVAAGAGQRYMSCYYRDKDSSWSAMPAFVLTTATNNSHWIGAVAINKTSTSYIWDTPAYSTAGSDFGTANTGHSATTGSLATERGGFVIIGTVQNDNVTMTSGAMTQTGATLGTITERCDGGTATGNDVAGTIHTCSPTVGATAALTFTGTLSAASQGGTIVIRQTESAPIKMGILTETFATYDTAKWVKTGATANVNVTADQLAITVTTAVDENGYDSVSAYDLTGSSLIVEIPDAGADTSQHETYFLAMDGDWQNALDIHINEFPTVKIKSVKTVNTTGTTITNINYNATDHRWLRIRESGGTIFFDTSPDGVTWSNTLGSTANPAINVRALKARLQADNSGTASTGSTTLFDNVNNPPVTVNPGQFFAMF